jgi:hypothetical protein
MNFKPPLGPYWYRKVPPDSVEDETRTCAENAIKFFADDLMIAPPHPSIQWILEEAWQNAEQEELESLRLQKSCDCFNREYHILAETPFEFINQVLVLSTLDSGNLIQVIAHEMRHVWQERHHGRVWRQHEQQAAEVDAEHYADEAIQRYPEYRRLPSDMEQRNRV